MLFNRTWIFIFINIETLLFSISLFLVLFSPEFDPPSQPHAVCDAGPNPDWSVPFLPGISNYDWLWLSLHH